MGIDCVKFNSYGFSMNQLAVPWTSFPRRAWNVLEHLEMSLLFEDECFRLVDKRWFSVPSSEPFSDSSISYAQSTMKALIEAGIFELKTHDDDLFLFLTARGYATVRKPPLNEL